VTREHILPRADGGRTRSALLRRYSVIVVALIAMVTGAWFEREVLLRGSADLWIVSDPITAADAVVVLGGGIEVRPFVAADLYAKGLVNKVLLSDVEDGPSVGIGLRAGHTELNRRILLHLGVPNTAIEVFGTANKNTYEEAVALKDWAVRRGASALIIPTEVFSSRRVRWVLRREFSGTAVRIEVPSFDPPNKYSRARWWKTEDGIIAFQNEVLKYIYYRWNY
jgi:uncharacterized SAM-binding protein YcdF (DUF218 family)